MTDQPSLFTEPVWTDAWPPGSRFRDSRGLWAVARVFETQRPAFTVHDMSMEVVRFDGLRCIRGSDTGMVAVP